MKVYRGFNKDIGPISYNDWIYVTPDLEQAKWYASRDGQIKNGEVIEYEISDKLNFLSIDDVNNIMFNEDEEYSIEDLLWYQEGLSDYLYEYGAGIEFEDPKFKNHIIYILFDEKYLKNGKIMKNNLNEAYIKAENGNIYYTKNSDMFLSMVKSIFISNNKAVRVYYDINKGLYVFGDAFNYIHADLANGMKYHSNIYGPDEMRANVSYLRENCALFQVLPDDDFKKYDVGDGYTDGWFLKIDDLIFACRNKQYHKLRDEVPLFKDYIGYWMPTDYYIAKKQGLTETVDPKLNDNFWKWFGNSKVVDEQGNPLIVYHGTKDNFTIFKREQKNRYDSGYAGTGFYFTNSKNVAQDYADWKRGYNKPSIMSVYLNIKNPLYVNPEGGIKPAIQKALGLKVDKNPFGISKELSDLITKTAQEKGYDGIIYDGLDDDKIYVVFNSNQIKSVNNNGNWSNDSNNINESVEEKIIAYHGSQHKKFNFRNDKVLYLTTDKKKAESYAKREWDEGLIEGEIPVVYTFEISVKNPYVCHTENEFQCEFCDVNMNLEGGKEELIEKGYDSIKYKDLIGVFSSSQIKLIDTEVLPPSMDYYYPKDTKDGDEDINDYYYDEEELNESVQNDTDEKLNSKTNCKIVLKDGKTIYGHLLSVNENYVYINSNNGNRIKKDNIKELYMYYDCEVITKNGKTIYGNFVGDFGDHKLHLDDSFNRKGWAIKDGMIEKVNYKKVIKHTFNSEKLNESVIDDKTFYTKQLSRMLDICMNIGNARFIYISETGLFVIGNALNCTHISLFLDALQEGKFDIGDMDIDEYFDEYIHSAEDTGAIITKEYANDKNIWMKSPDSTNVINDYGKFYLCNGLCIEDSLAELTNIKPKYVKYISYLDESVNNKPKLITAYRGIDSDKFKFKNGAPQWFSSCEGIAKSFGDIIYEAKLKLNNPADLTNDKELYIILKDMIKEYEESYRSRYNQIRGYLVDYIKETYPDFDISDIDDNTLISLSKQLKDVPYNIEHYIWIFNELNIILDCISKQESWAGLFHKYIYPNWDRVIKTVQEQGYDSIISLEETSNRSYIDIGYVIWNNENIVSIKKISKNINESVEDKILYIIRGVPGSGKSTLAHKLTDNVVEADQYFYDDKGNYNWSADKLNQAHNWCFYTVKKYMEEGRDKIAVANTFVKNRDYKRYVELAKEFGYKVDIRTCTGNYQNIHNVPDETVEKMRSKFQETPLDESVKLVNKELSDTKLITTPFEMNNYLKNNNETRFVYDTEKKWYLVGDVENSIHINLLNDALADGYYEPFEYNGKIINADSADLDAKAGKLLYQTNPNRFLLFRTSSDQLNGEDYYYDRYKYCYVYNNYCIFSRDINFEKTSLYKVLGKPNELEFIGDIDEDEGLNESIAYASKKDLSDIILKNPTRKELKENGLEFCRYMFEDDNTYYFVDAKEYSHLDLAQLFLDVFKNYNLHTDGGYYSVKENCFYIRNDFGCEKNKERLDNTKLLHKLFGNFKSIIYEGDYPEGYSKELDESAENDRTLRDYAVKLVNICLDALVKTKYETKISKEQVQINVDKAFKKAVPMLKNSPYEYFIILVSKNDELYASYGKTVDRKYGLITLPVFSKDPIDQTLSILYKHKSMLNKLYSTYSGDELKLKINEYAIKYLKKELEKSLSNVKSEYIDILIHECTHLLDDVRRTKTYNKSKEQNLKDDKGIENYYNSPEEQNAYYQETVSIFDEYAENKLVGYKTFDIFWDDFIRQYRGEYNMLNDKNKRKLKKRAYTYWYVYMKD